MTELNDDLATSCEMLGRRIAASLGEKLGIPYEVGKVRFAGVLRAEVEQLSAGLPATGEQLAKQAQNRAGYWDDTVRELTAERDEARGHLEQLRADLKHAREEHDKLLTTNGDLVRQAETAEIEQDEARAELQAAAAKSLGEITYLRKLVERDHIQSGYSHSPECLCGESMPCEERRRWLAVLDTAERAITHVDRLRDHLKAEQRRADDAVAEVRRLTSGMEAEEPTYPDGTRPARDVLPGWELKQGDGWIKVRAVYPGRLPITEAESRVFELADDSIWPFAADAPVACRTPEEAADAG